MRVLAIDWSGAARVGHRHTWLAEATEAERLVRLECLRDRFALADHLLAHCEPAVIGLDFGFSFPSWFLRQSGITAAQLLWLRVAQQGESWLAECAPPFWGRPGRPRPPLEGPAFRRAELAVPRQRGIGPKSMFQIGGAGAVGTGSIRGMPLLQRWSAAGATIWPFISGNWPIVVEIYPRLLTGGVRKSNVAARRELLEERYPRLHAEHMARACLSEDAFDAAVSALVMIEHIDDLAALPEEVDPELQLEGRIWHPDWRTDRP